MYTINKAIILSLVFHLLLMTFFAQQFSPKKSLPNINKINKVRPIQAKLYFPPKKKQVTVPTPKEKVEGKATNIIVEKIKIESSIVVQEKIVAEKKSVKASINESKKMSKQMLTSKTSTKSIGQNAFEKLQHKLDAANLKRSQEDNIKEYLANKNYIPPSTTKLHALPKPQIPITEVDCANSAINTTITAISGLLGGGVKCNSMPNLKDFLENRKKNKGK